MTPWNKKGIDRNNRYTQVIERMLYLSDKLVK